MVIDSSALVAIHLKEPGYDRLLDAIEQAEMVLVGAPTMVETAMILTARLGRDARPLVFAFLRRLNVQVVTFNEMHLEEAIAAFLRFGRWRHPAGLNFGDCMSYAVASVAGLPLLFTGKDFGRTDIARA